MVKPFTGTQETGLLQSLIGDSDGSIMVRPLNDPFHPTRPEKSIVNSPTNWSSRIDPVLKTLILIVQETDLEPHNHHRKSVMFAELKRIS